LKKEIEDVEEDEGSFYFYEDEPSELSDLIYLCKPILKQLEH